jgi:hypothetical protein
MSYQRLTIALILSLALPVCAFAQQQDSYSERYNLEIHLGGFMDRLYNVLTQPQWLGQHKEVADTANMLKQLGLFNLENVQAEYVVDNGQVAIHCAKHYQDLPAESYLGQVYALPNKPLELAGYVPADALLYVGMNNVPQQALLAARKLSEVAASAKESGGPLSDAFGDADLSQVFGMLDAFNVEQQVNDTLTGEIGLAVFDTPSVEAMTGDNFGPQDISAAIMIGIKDANRVKQLIAMAGSNAPLAPMEGDMGGWSGWYVTEPGAEGVGVMLGEHMLFITPNVQNAVAHFDFSGQAQAIPACQAYFDLNVSRLQDGLIEPAMQVVLGGPVDNTATKDAARYLFALPPSDALGHIRAVTIYDNGYESAFTMNTALANYLFYYVGVGTSLMAQHEMASHQDDDSGEGEGGE